MKNSLPKTTESMSFQVHWDWLSKSANTSRTLGDALAWVREGEENFKGCLSPIYLLELQGNPHDGEGAVSLEHHQLSAGDWVSMADCFKTWQICLFERSIECALNVLYFNSQNNSNSISQYEWKSLLTPGRGPGRREFLKRCVAHFHDEGKWKKKE